MKYRIKMTQNGLGEWTYIPQYRLFLWFTFSYYDGWDFYPEKCDTLEEAKEVIEEDKTSRLKRKVIDRNCVGIK